MKHRGVLRAAKPSLAAMVLMMGREGRSRVCLRVALVLAVEFAFSQPVSYVWMSLPLLIPCFLPAVLR